MAKVIRAADEQRGESLRRRNVLGSLRILLLRGSSNFAFLLILATKALSPRAPMPIPRLLRDRTALLVIDVQERLLPTIHEGAAVATNCGLLLDVAARLGLPAIVTEQYVKGLGRSVEPIAARIAGSITLVEKTRFSAAVPPVMQALDRAGVGTVLLCGVEAHVCVLQTALDLLAAGRQVVLAHDAISSGDRVQIQPAFDRMLAAGAVTAGVLGAAYELLGDASDPAFREVLAIVKKAAPRSLPPAQA